MMAPSDRPGLYAETGDRAGLRGLNPVYDTGGAIVGDHARRVATFVFLRRLSFAAELEVPIETALLGPRCLELAAKAQ